MAYNVMEIHVSLLWNGIFMHTSFIRNKNVVVTLFTLEKLFLKIKTKEKQNTSDNQIKLKNERKSGLVNVKKITRFCLCSIC